MRAQVEAAENDAEEIPPAPVGMGPHISRVIGTRPLMFTLWLEEKEDDATVRPLQRQLQETS
jgi:hypothetical protein